MVGNIKDCVTFANGVQMPWLGLGVWQIDDAGELDGAVRAALDAGYRSIDTAEIYGNEEGVGKAIKASGVPRGDLFLTTKLWNEYQSRGHDAIRKAFERSLRLLGTDYVDLFLIHWPIRGKYVEAWKTLLELKRDGLARAVGVSNFQPHHIDDVAEATGVLPEVNQVELHPFLTQKPLIEYCRGKGIQVEAYSPLANGHLGEIKGLGGIAARYGKTPAQVALRWSLDNGIVVIPKSTHNNRIMENSDIFDFSLSREDRDAIDAMNRNRRYLPDPDVFGYRN